MSDDIRRKKKKQGRRPKNTDEKEKEIAGRDKKEPEPVKEKSEPDALLCHILIDHMITLLKV